MNQLEFQSKLDALADNDFEDMNIDFDVFIENSLKHIGATDPELRDELIFPFLATLVYEELIDDSKYNDIVSKLIGDEHLFYKMNENDQDAVFKRSFSALALSAILHNHNERSFLSTEVENQVLNHVEKYMTHEKDYRGFVSEKGWAHSVAHIADVSACLASNKNLSKNQVESLIYKLKDMYLNNNEVFTHNEDERIVTAICKYIKREDFDKSALINWIESIDKSKFVDEYPQDIYTRINSKQLLRSLYFNVKKMNQMDDLLVCIDKQLELF